MEYPESNFTVLIALVLAEYLRPDVHHGQLVLPFEAEEVVQALVEQDDVLVGVFLVSSINVSPEVFPNVCCQSI